MNTLEQQYWITCSKSSEYYLSVRII